MKSFGWLAGTICGWSLLAVAGAEPPPQGAQEVLTLEQHVRPILRAHCLDCHGAVEKLEGDLDLRLVRTMQQGGISGPAIVPGDPENSYLIERIRSGEMPPGEQKLTADELARLIRWIAEGARTAREEPASLAPGLGITPEDQAYWAFQPLRSPAVALAALDTAGLRGQHVLDNFLQDASHSASHQPSGAAKTSLASSTAKSPNPNANSRRQGTDIADRRVLLRRASLVLTGLPPSAEDTAAALADPRDDWFDRSVERLLASPHYGEHWARHWLDAAGYADSDGATAADTQRPWAWRYRDWVIRAFNEDMPLDQFVTEQLAGDELAGPISGDLTSKQIDLLTATGFLRMAADGTGSGGDTPEGRNQTINDTLKIVGTSLFGLSLHCAQCHDHRYDPILQSDYYALRAVFAPALDWQQWKPPAARLVSLMTEAEREQGKAVEEEAQTLVAERDKKQAAAMEKALDKELAKVDEPLRGELREAYQTPEKQRTEAHKQLLAKHPSVQITPGVLYQYLPEAAEELKKIDEQIKAVRAKKPAEQFIQALVEPAGHLPETKLFYRGDHQQPKHVVSPGGLAVLAPGGQRIEFPVDDPDLPTSGRRLALARWLTDPAQPLLARVLVNRVWLHHFGEGLVATAGDFGRLGSAPRNQGLLDALAYSLQVNGWSLKNLHRQIMRSELWQQAIGEEAPFRNRLMRLEAESIRDAMLVAADQWDRSMYGRPVAIKEDDAGQVIVAGSQTRRSLYIENRRSQPVSMLQAFDAPVMETNCERRASSTVAPQSLMLMNGNFILEQAAWLADSVLREPYDAAIVARTDLPALLVRQWSWQYGMGRYDEATERTADFQQLNHWTGSQWQAGPGLPDPQAGWVLLSAKGGHPDNPQRSVIRRWVAPSTGQLQVTGKLSHGSSSGDGVRGRLVASNSGLRGAWMAASKSIDTPVDKFLVQAGETLDWITECVEHQTSDSFEWVVTLDWTPDNGSAERISSAEQFRGPQLSDAARQQQIAAVWRRTLGRPPTPAEWQLVWQFAGEQLDTMEHPSSVIPSGSNPWREVLVHIGQALMSSNEFLYVP